MNFQVGDKTSPHHLKTFTACFSVVAESDPNSLSRILEPFTKRGLLPSHVYAMRTGADGEMLQVDIHLADTDDETSWRLANDLRGLWLVQTVLTSEKQRNADIA